MMTGQLAKDAFLWGSILWGIGYIFGILLFPFVPPSMIGWTIMPVGIIFTLWILVKKIKGTSLHDYALVGSIWTLIAIVCDYLFLVQVFQPTDGYYKLDVYLYYILTFTLPIMVYTIYSSKR